MEYRKKFILQTLVILVLIACMFYMAIDKPDIVYHDTTESCKEDSLQKIINELQMENKILSDGFDSKEKRYEEIIFEFGYGIDHLKIYQPQAYREFHRILSHKEYFSREDEQDNIKRLEIPKW